MRKEKWFKRILSVIMCIAVIFSIAIPLCTVAFSEEDVGTIEMNKTYTADKDSINQGCLTLDVYATGERVVSKMFNLIDEVMVLDISGSLSEVRDVVSWKKGVYINSVL